MSLFFTGSAQVTPGSWKVVVDHANQGLNDIAPGRLVLRLEDGPPVLLANNDGAEFGWTLSAGEELSLDIDGPIKVMAKSTSTQRVQLLYCQRRTVLNIASGVG